MTGRIYTNTPEGYNEFDSMIIGLFGGKTPDMIETREDGYVYVTFGNKVYKLDYVYVKNSKFEGNVYAVMAEVTPEQTDK